MGGGDEADLTQKHRGPRRGGGLAPAIETDF